MNFAKQIALLTAAACMGLFLTGCEPSDARAKRVPTLVSMSVSPSAATVPLSSTLPLRVTATYSDSSTLDVTTAVRYTSSATAVAIVSSSGVVTAIRTGSATITATETASGRTATATIVVPQPSLVSIALRPVASTLGVGASQSLTVVATYSEGSTAVLATGVTFVSSNEAVATVSAAGVLTAVAEGTATITATETQSGRTTIASATVVAGGGGGGGGDFAAITFDDPAIVYTLTGFGGAEDSSVASDPIGGTNKVARVVKAAAAELWAGTTVSTRANLSVGRIPFDAGNTRMQVRVYSPTAGIPVRLKVEDSNNPGVTVETEAVTTVANTWENLTFDFANPATGTAALDVSQTYDKVSIFFNFGRTGAESGGAKTYFFDDLIFIGGTGGGGGGTDAFETITFDSATATYTLTGFGGAEGSTVAADPVGGSNLVARVVKSATAELWAGTTVSTGPNQSVGRIPFDASNTRMTVRVYSPTAGIPVRLKVESAADPTITVETEALTTAANTWETLTFDFASPATGTAALDVSQTYDKVSIFFNFGKTGAESGGEKIYFFDDLTFIGGTGGGGGGGGGTEDFQTITFDSAALTYTLTGFGGAEDSTVAADPAGGTNQVARVVKSATAELWAGTTVSTGANQSVGTIPIDAANTRMTVRVYSPVAGIPVRLKAEDAADPTHTVETEATTTVANAWETLTFDFANEATGTAELNPAYTFDKLSIFFDFGTTGAAAGGARTYHFDDVTFIGGTGGGGGGGVVEFATVTFDSGTVTYTLTGFGGAEDSTVVTDPIGGTNQVARVVKSGAAELWAGTTVATGANQSVGKIPFDAANTRMTVRVYSPTVGIPVRLKVENAANPGVSVETEAVTTVANTWETLIFDFANEATGTAALDVSQTYDKASIFFNFGRTGAESGGEKIYFFDDLAFIGGTGNGGGGAGTFQTITFDSATVTYTLTGFGGAEDATVAADPAGGTNLVGRVVKSATAELWAGTTVSTGASQSVGTIPFSATRTRMTVRVYSPVAGIQVRLKTEDAADPTRSVETEATTTVANAWETLTFDFASPAGGTAALNLAYTYNKVSIFFDFGVTGVAAGGARTYYFDDLVFLP